MRVTLIPHPETPSARDLRVAVEFGPMSRREARLRYLVSGDIAVIAWPARGEPARKDELWKHTCFEAFARDAPGLAYHEFNFSPSTCWAAYGFDAHRAGMHEADVPAPRIETRQGDGEYELHVAFNVPGAGPWRLALSAVLELASGEKSYWALSHPPGAPDFHHAAGFAFAFADEDLP